MKRTFLEFMKDLVIVLLLCSLALLTLLVIPTESIRRVPWLAAALQPVAPLLGLSQAELTYVEPVMPVMDAAQPLAISVRNSAGRSTAQWDFDRLDASFETLGGILGEALDTAGPFSPVSQNEMLTALSADSVYYDYGHELPTAVLASWLDASMEVDAPAGRAYALAPADGAVKLYLLGDGCHAAETQVSAEALSALLAQFRPDDSHFSFETYVKLSPWTLLPAGTPDVSAAAVSNPCDNRFVEQLAITFGFNPYGDASYTDAQGVTSFTEVGCALQVTPEGEILLTSAAADRFQAASGELDALVEEARLLVEQASGGALGDARLYLSGLTQEDDRTVCTFDYVLSGVPVILPDRSAAQVTFTGRAVTGFSILLKTYTRTAEPLRLLPVYQAAALLPEGSPLALQYLDSGANTLTAGWREQ